MNCFYFGDSQRPLYGVYHPPSTPGAGSRGVVLLYPFGQEYMRAHRAFRQLALLLSRRGVHVLRFDYHGTGDSSGEGEECRVGTWLTDVGAAIDELRDLAALEAVSLVGLRLGAALAVRAAAGRSDVESLVLWDPLVRGRDYIDEILTNATHVERHRSGTIGVNGFPITPALLEDILALDLLAPQGLESGRVHLVVSAEREIYRLLRGRLAEERLRVSDKLVDAPSDWNQVDDFGGVLIPQAIIKEIVSWLTEERSA